MINFINCLFLMDFYEPFEEMEANNVCFFLLDIIHIQQFYVFLL